MTGPRFEALPLTRISLRALIALNVIIGGLILVLLIASLLFETKVMVALGVGEPGESGRMIGAMRVIMVVGIAAMPLTHILLACLLAIVDAVRNGDPFVAKNAARLQTIAWMLLGLQLLHLVVGAAATWGSSEGQLLDIHWRFSVTGWLAVLLCFVLARVFDHGAQMRADLEGTV